MSQQAVFLCSGQPTTFFFREGKRAAFRENVIPGVTECVYLVDMEKFQHEYDELMDEIKKGHPMIHQQKGLEFVEEEDLDPLKAIKNAAAHAARIEMAQQMLDAGLKIPGITTADELADSLKRQELKNAVDVAAGVKAALNAGEITDSTAKEEAAKVIATGEAAKASIEGAAPTVAPTQALFRMTNSSDVAAAAAGSGK